VQVTGPIALQLGFAYTGLMSDFRMIDWTEPYLMTFANNEIEMPLTIGADAKASAIVRSTGQLGQRTYAKAPSGFSIAKGCFVPKAYADEASYQQMTKWWGKIKAGATQAAIMAITINQYVNEMKKNIARGAVLGDVSTASGIVGDIAVGAIPFGDLRDIALQSYYLATDSDKFKKSVYTLSWIGLAADALIVTGVGEVVNVGIAGGKTFIKVLNTIDLDAVIALNKVLGNYFEMAAEAIKKGDWKLVEKCIPVLQLGAAIVIDDELRGPLLKVLGGAIHSIDDLEAWMLYLAGWDETAADDPELIAGLSPMQRLVQPAHAGTISAFKKLLKELLAKYPPGKEEELGKALTDIFRSLNMVVDDAQLLKTIKYNLGTIVSTINIYKIGGRQAIEDLRLAGNIWRKIDDLVADIRKLNYEEIDDKLNAVRSELPKGFYESAQGAQNSLRNLLSRLNQKYNAYNGPKGAAHHIRVLADMIDDVVGVELKLMTVAIENGAKLGDRKYDLLAKIGGIWTRIECKSWLPENIASNTRKLLQVGVDSTEDGIRQNKQLLIDLVAFKENGYQGFKWIFDIGMQNNKELFKGTIIDVLVNDDNTKKKIMGLLGQQLDVEYSTWVTGLSKNLDAFIMVKP